MILTPGQLYFINEQDVQTGARSSYYKIGIVRDAAGRDSKNRLLEHQTGNPRKLCIVEALSMPAVEATPTILAPPVIIFDDKYEVSFIFIHALKHFL